MTNIINRPIFTEFARPPVADLGGRPQRRPGDMPIIVVGKPAPASEPAPTACPVPEIRDDLRRISTGLSVLLEDVSALSARCEEHLSG